MGLSIDVWVHAHHETGKPVEADVVKFYGDFDVGLVELLPHNLPGRFEIENKKSKDKQGMQSLADGVKAYEQRLETKGK